MAARSRWQALLSTASCVAGPEGSELHAATLTAMAHRATHSPPLTHAAGSPSPRLHRPLLAHRPHAGAVPSGPAAVRGRRLGCGGEQGHAQLPLRLVVQAALPSLPPCQPASALRSMPCRLRWSSAVVLASCITCITPFHQLDDAHLLACLPSHAQCTWLGHPLDWASSLCGWRASCACFTAAQRRCAARCAFCPCWSWPGWA